MKRHIPVVIVGAGLSGLYAAWRLHQQAVDVLVLEARDRAGGRIQSASVGDILDHSVDMGPAWIWPQYQNRLQRLIDESGLKCFKQFCDGDSLYEADGNNIERYGGVSSHAESYRIEGGCAALIDFLKAQIPDFCVSMNTQVQSIEASPLTIRAIRSDKPVEYTADKIILAMPPRLIQQSVSFNPLLPQEIAILWSSIPTWMAGQCKIIFIYSRAFWREQGLSGEVFSRYGPLTEIYDASPASESFFALTSFVGVNAQQRQKISNDTLIKLSLEQLQRLFGKDSLDTIDIKLTDWSNEVFTSCEADITNPASHPYYPETSPRTFYNNCLFLAGTETANEHGGYLEGALESADEALKNILL